MARICRNRNKKTGRFQKSNTKNTKRTCFTVAGRRKKASSKRKSAGWCVSKKSGLFTKKVASGKCRKGSKKVYSRK